MEFIRKNVNNRTNTVTSSSGGGSYSGSSGFSGTLETHTIFSQPFNGTYDVRGDLADVDKITANDNISTDGSFIVRGKDDDGVYTEQDLKIYVNDSGAQFGGVLGYNFDNNINAPLFNGNVNAKQGTVEELSADNISVEEDVTVNGDISSSKCIITNTNGDEALSISIDSSGTKFTGGLKYQFDNTVQATTFEGDVEADNVNTISLNSSMAYAEELTADNATITNDLSTNNFDASYAEIIKIISENIEVDNITVKKAAHFFKLIIDEIKSVGGQLIISPANASFDKVVVDDSNYKCYFRAEADGKKIDNQFEVDDQVVCQTFNAAEGTNFNTSNKFYWRLVIAKGTEKLSGIDYHYIILSDSDKDGNSNGVPTEGDKVALLGNRNDTSRQNAIIISAYSSAFLDSGITAPFIVQYSGINNYNLSAHRNSIISNGKNLFTGDFVLTSGEDVGGQISEIKATANNISLLIQEPEQVNIFESSDGNNYGCWNSYGTTDISKKYNTDYILVLGGTNGGYILQPSKYQIKNDTLKVSVNVSELQGLGSYYTLAISDVSGNTISNTYNLVSGNVSYNFTLNKIPNSIVCLKITLASNARLAFKNEIAYIQSLPKRLSEIEVDIDSITSRVSDAEGNITKVTQKANGLTTQVSTLEGNVSQVSQKAEELSSKITSVEGDISQITQTTNSITSRISNVETGVSNVTQRADELSAQISNLEGDVSEVSQKADTLESTVANIKVGGSNLLDDSAFTTFANSSDTTWRKKNASADKQNGYMNQIGIQNTSNPTNTATYGYMDMAEQVLKYKLKANTYYTFSFYAKGYEGTATVNGSTFNYKPRIATYVYPDVSTETPNNYKLFTLTNQWQRYFYTFKTKSNLDENGTYCCLFRLQSYKESNGSTFYANGYVCMPKLEEGTVPTAWDTTDADMKSYITQKADLIESKIVTEDTINSKITQSKDSIKAEVYNEMNQATGIDITTGTITLNADKTVFNGNINIRNSDEGVVVFDDKGNASVIIQNKKIPSLSNLDNSTHDYIQTDNFSTGANNTFTSAPQKIGTAKSGDVISVTGGSLYYCYVTSDNQVKLITLNGTSYLEYYYTIKNTTTGKSSNSSVFNHKTIQDSLEGILMSGANFSITEDGDYEVILNITHCNPTMIYSTYRIVWGYYFNKKVSQYTQLGTNGLVSVQDKYKYMYFGDEGFEARMAYYNGFRVGKYRCQQVLGENDGTTVWGSLVSKVEMAVNPQTTSMNVVAGGTSQGTKNVVRADANYYDMDMFVFRSLSTEVWIKLPVSYVEYNGVGYYIGIGRVIKIRNLTTQKCYVYVSDTSTKIYDSSGASGVSYLNIGNSSAEFAWDGTEWIRTK